jgi:hypothetical protein
MGRVDPLDVVGRIGLGETEPLRVLEHLGKRDALIGHAGEDIVGGAVHDPHDREDAVGHQPFLQGFDHRDAAADAGLEADLDPLGRRRKDVGPFLGKQRLVGGDHMLAGGSIACMTKVLAGSMPPISSTAVPAARGGFVPGRCRPCRIR